MQRFEGKTVLVTGGNSGIIGGGQGIRGRRRARHHHRCDAQTLEPRGKRSARAGDPQRGRQRRVGRALADAIASAGRGSTPCSSTRASRSSRRSPIATRPCGISCSTPT